jgi:hypothetical protein
MTQFSCDVLFLVRDHFSLWIGGFFDHNKSNAPQLHAISRRVPFTATPKSDYLHCRN